MNFIRKLAPLVAAVGLSVLTNAAHADVLTPFDVKNGAGSTYVAGATALDWSSKGTGVAVGVGREPSGPLSGSLRDPLPPPGNRRPQGNAQ